MSAASPIGMPTPPKPFQLGARVAIIRAAHLALDEARRCTLRNRLAKAEAARAEARRLMRAAQS
jgi:hypothetical protein